MSERTALETQLLRACLTASSYLQALGPGQFKREEVLNLLTQAIQASCSPVNEQDRETDSHIAQAIDRGGLG